MLHDQINNNVSSWAIRWQAVCILNNWLIFYPNPSLTNHMESQEATHANVNILPPLATRPINTHFLEIKENKNVIKAMKLGYSNRGDYFGKLKRDIILKKIKNYLTLFLPPLIFIIFKKLNIFLFKKN
jgi:hypothetical protein